MGAYGKQSDGGIFSSSNIYNRLETDNFNMPEPKVLPNSDILAPYVLLGDEAYPLKVTIIVDAFSDEFIRTVTKRQ